MTVISFGNFKGGVGKTTSALLFGYVLSEYKDKKVLLIDTDPQTNLTELVELTFKNEINYKKNIFTASFSGGSFQNHIQNITENLDIISGSWDMLSFEDEAKKKYKKNGLSNIFRSKLESLKDQYDYILFDTAPTTNLVTDNVIFSSDYVLITTQTLPSAFKSTKKYYQYLESLSLVSDDFELLGVIPYLVGKSATDREYLAKYSEFFKEDLFESVIRLSDRVKTWSGSGVTSDQPHDKNTLKMYIEIVEEALRKIEEMEK